MSKLSFRSRQVDYTKPLPIYLNNDLPDLQDFAAINRSVPQMPTGMEKDEEAEHHLQRALSALQAFGDKSSNDYSIPTPKVNIDNKMYDRIYNIECPKQKQYIRIQPFSNDYDYPDYDADYEDEAWCRAQQQKLPADFVDDLLYYFETVMDKLEKVTSYSSNLMTETEARFLLLKDADNDENDFLNNNTGSVPKPKYRAELEEFLMAVYEYWKMKRTRSKHPLTPIVMTDKSTGIVNTTVNNPYLVFRRRTEKMQTRKNRKNEEQSYEKMLILKRDLCRAQHILKLIKKRENLKKDFLQLTLETFEKRYKLSDYDGSIMEQITCLLRPPINSTQLPQAANHTNTANFSNNTHLLNQMENVKKSLSQNNNHYNSNKASEKNLSSIDKTIVSLINSNKLKTLGSPPHSSLKKLGGSLTENDFLVDSIYNGTDKAKLGADNKVRRNKKEKRVRNEDSTSSTTSTISSLISHGLNKHGQLDQLTSKRLIGDLIDLSNKGKQMQMKSMHGKPIGAGQHNSQQGVQKASISPLGNRLAAQQQQQVNKLELLRRSYKNLNLAELDQLQLNRLANAQRRRRSTAAATATAGEAPIVDAMSNNKKMNTSEAESAAMLLGSNNNNNNNNGRPVDSAVADLMASPPAGAQAASQKSDDLMQIFNELRDYEEELRVNQIENLDSMLSETKSRVSTSSDKDGYWYFKRKEGCKYLPQNGPIFKNDVLEEPVFAAKPSLAEPVSEPLGPPPQPGSQPQLSSVAALQHHLSKRPKKLKRKERLRELQQFYYGYVVTKQNRNIGLVRRRVGRGGRIILDRFNEDLRDCIGNSDLSKPYKNSPAEQMLAFNFSKFKTYYPYECFELTETAVKNSESNNNTSSESHHNLPITIAAQLVPPQASVSMNAAHDQANQPVKKKLKLKNFEDLMTTTKDEPDFVDSYFDHSLFSSYQLANNEPVKSQFIDQTTEAELLDIEKADALADAIKIKPQAKPKSIIPAQQAHEITNPVNYDFDTLGTDLDLDNLFEPDENSNECTITDVQNVIKLESKPGTRWNLEYHQRTSEELLNLGSVKVALKTLMISAPAATNDETNPGPTSRMDTNSAEDDGKPKEDKINETTSFRLPSPANSENMSTASKTVLATNFNSSDSLANITSTTQLTPPSPSPPSSQSTTTIVNNSAPAVSNDQQQVKDVNVAQTQHQQQQQQQQQPQNVPQQALNKITLLSSTQTNGNANARFNSQLNKVETDAETNNTNNSITSSSVDSTHQLSTPVQQVAANGIGPSNYLVKKHVNPDVTSAATTQINNSNNGNSNINNDNHFYTTSSSSNASSSSASASSSSSTNNNTSTNNSNGTSNSNSIISSQPSSVIVNGLLSKKKAENSPFYPVYQQHQQASQHSPQDHHQQQTNNSNSTKLLQAIHFSQSNIASSSTMSTAQPGAYATTSSVPSSSSGQNHSVSVPSFAMPVVLTNSNHLKAFQKQAGATGPINGQSITEHNKSNTSKLM